MPRMWLVALALISLAACGGSSSKHAAGAGTKHAASRAQTSTAKSRQPASSKRSKSKGKTSTRPDTAQRNPLVNH